MKHEDLHVLWDRAQRVVQGTEKQRRDAAAIPVDHYLDPDRHARERAALRAWPHVVCTVDAVREPGDWRAVEILGVPLLLSRGTDGVLRAFLNVCRHRGVVIMDGCGQGRRSFTCPYHAWTYDTTGALVGRPHEADFPHVPRESAGLVGIPVASRFGLVWVVPSVQEGYDWPAYFGAMGDDLEGIGYGDACVGTHHLQGDHPANWKLLVEGALETYHFQYAHRKTIAPYFHDNAVQVETFGEHQRVTMPRRSLIDAAARHPAPDQAQFGRHASLLHFFFPSSFLLWNGDHATAFIIRPGAAPDRAETDSFMVVPPDLHAARDAAHWDTNWKRFWDPLTEDYALSAAIQRGLASGANRTLAYGTNEFAGPQFHAALERMTTRTIPLVPAAC